MIYVLAKKREFEYKQMTSSCCCRVGSGLNVILSVIVISTFCVQLVGCNTTTPLALACAIINYCIFKICVYLQTLDSIYIFFNRLNSKNRYNN